MQVEVDKVDLSYLGIKDYQELYRNLSYDELFSHETEPGLKGWEQGFATSTGAVAVDTGKFTGRSPRDKYIVREDSSQKHIWWTQAGAKRPSDNQPISEEVWRELKALAVNRLNGRKLYVMDAFCGANPNSRLSIRLVTEVAWMAHFAKNMFIRPSEEELRDFRPDFTILNACQVTNPDYQKMGLRSEVFVAFNINEKMCVIGGTWYGGEIKKGIFSMMNYFLPLRGIGAFHCSANQGKSGDTALFFGLSGTGKTTLSTDPNRLLIGDDEHGWDDAGVFNFEGGCYAKGIGLDPAKEPEIFQAVKRGALLENVDFDPKTGVVDFGSSKKTENTRVSYPIHHIHNIVRPVSKGGHPKNIIFLTFDAFGVLPPVSKLNGGQAMYHYLSGYTAKVAGTELGVTEPRATFSACFGAAFLTLHPTVYADILGKKMKQHDSSAYLVNTGLVSGGFGIGKRINLKQTRAIITAILNGSLENIEIEKLPIFGLQIPKKVAGVESEILNPRNCWQDKSSYDKAAARLASMFVENFVRFTDTPLGKSVAGFGPKL